jgi:hypothetical protein
MKYHIMHEDHNIIVCTPQYAREYKEAIKKHYPNHKVEPTTQAPHGNAYLFNEDKLKEEYKVKIQHEDNNQGI